MGSKKKRKSAASADEQPAKRPSSQQGRRPGGSGSGEQSLLAWSAEGVAVTLPAGKALLFVGRASLAVQSGEVAAFGSLISASSGSVEVCADERCGGALLLEPGAALGTVPLAASSTTVFTLTRLAGTHAAGMDTPSTPQPTGNGSQQQSRQNQRDSAEISGSSGGVGGQLGFEVWLAGDPSTPCSPPPPLPPLWQQAAAEVEDSMAAQAQQGGGPPVIVVCGAKKVGKSTFARFLVNSLLNRHPCIGYLDTDCGQPEFTAPGLVSLSLVSQPLLGPPHMHQRRPAAAFFLGDTSPASHPVRYLQYVRELYCWYCQHAAAAAAAQLGSTSSQQQQGAQLPPLVVNTHGWVKGMGYDVLVELLQSLPVSHFVQIAAANPKKNLPPGCFWLASGDPQAGQQQQGAPVAEPAQWLLPGLGGDQTLPQPTVSDTSARSTATIGAAASEGGTAGAGGGGRGRLNAVEQRGLQWEALAQQCIDCCSPAPSTAAARAGASGKEAYANGVAASAAGPASELGDRLAAAVPLEVDMDGLEVQVLHSSVPPSQLLYALNCSVVGLCTVPPQPPAGAVAPGSPVAFPCLGLGIVRAVDAQQRRLYILTAVPEEELESVAVLQLGRLELPASLLQTGAHLSPYLCLHSLSSMGTGAGAIKSRNNLLRQSQL